ncbi:MAG: VCBS repeat-containing protein [Planctomycetes bacterium]|nr:VCBS repeat-containing protein [Planctomycetota bacterium]
MNVLARLTGLACALAWLSTAVGAQFNNSWATFTPGADRIRNPDGSTATQVTADNAEKDYAWGDLNGDGWIDLVVVRAEGWSMSGKRVNQLLMNERGVLVDRTAQYATDSDVPGDFGFLTPTNDRDVQIIDLTGDGWPEIVTAVTLSDSNPKHISHPRVYRNKGLVGGVWQGFRYEDARIPQLLTISGGVAVAPRFMSVSVGDVNGDGFADLYFTDYDSMSPLTEAPGNDLNDRLLINDGAGNFTDSLQTRMSAGMLMSTNGLASKIIDVNGDGARDIVKLSSQHPNGDNFVAYNLPSSVGIFGAYQAITPSGAAYHMDLGDLNQDGRPDLVVGDDGNDHYRINLANDPSGGVIWGPRTTYQFLNGSDDGFAGNIRIVDLDNDGWPDVIQTDVDAAILGCTRRTKIYHNLGGPIGGDVVLREEIEMAGANGWKGAVGMLAADLTGVFDAAVFDIDRDGDLDIVFGRCSGTFVWINQLRDEATVFCLGDGSATACPCGNASATADAAGCASSLGVGGRLRKLGTPSISADTLGLFATRVPNGPALFFQGTWAVGVGAGSVFGDGLLCAGGTITRLGVVFAQNQSSLYPRAGIDPQISLQPGLTAGDARTYQAWCRDAELSFCTPEVFNLTNGLAITWQN